MFWNDKKISSELVKPAVYLEDFEETTVEVDVRAQDSNPKEWEGTGTAENAPVGSLKSETESEDKEWRTAVSWAGHMLNPTTRYKPETGNTVCWNTVLVTNYFKALQDGID